MQLEMRRRCEKCTQTLAADGEAYICSFEDTFCAACASAGGICPHCGGELVLRPRRSGRRRAPEESPAPVQPKIRRSRIWAVSFGVWTFISVAATATVYEMYHLSGSTTSLGRIAGMEFSELLTYAALTPFVYAFAVRYPIQRENWVRRSLLHLCGGLVLTAGHVVLRSVTPYGYWDPAIREWTSAVWDFHAHAFRAPWGPMKRMMLAGVVDDVFGAYVPILLVAHVVSYYHRFRERELRAAQLEGQLTKAHLHMLKSQLQPHFLFNTLHSISALMLTDVIAADRMMTLLSDLLRMSLEQNGTQLTTLSREIEFLGVYLEIEKTRFEDRMRVGIEIAPECVDAQVPHLLLQPLVENAVRHGIAKLSAGGEIRIVARVEAGGLQMWIRDNGPGLAEVRGEKAKSGLGLRVTRERLRALYGDEQRCEIGNRAEGGAEVYLRIPFTAVERIAKPEDITLSYT